MAYDIWKSSQTSPIVGPNAPLIDSCAASSRQVGSAASAADAWTKAGFPVNKVKDFIA